MINISKIKPNEFWYIIGYFATDGHLSKDRRHVAITSKDLLHLYKIRFALGLKTKILSKSNGSRTGRYYDLAFSDVNFYRYLESIGFMTRKSWRLGIVDIDVKYFRDFLRGVIDGDGCIYSWINNHNKYLQWALRISGVSKDFIEWIHNVTENILEVKGKIHTYKSKDINRSKVFISKFGKIAAQKILKSIYYSKCFCLERKLLIVKECLLDRK